MPWLMVRVLIDTTLSFILIRPFVGSQCVGDVIHKVIYGLTDLERCGLVVIVIIIGEGPIALVKYFKNHQRKSDFVTDCAMLIYLLPVPVTLVLYLLHIVS